MVNDNPETLADLDGHTASNEPKQLAEAPDVAGWLAFTRDLVERARENGRLSPLPLHIATDPSGQQQQGQQQGQGQQQQTTPPPLGPDGKLLPPSVPPPPDKDGNPNEWVPGKGTPDRPVRWDPKRPVPGQSQPNVSWDEKQGHWDYNDGKGNRTRRLPDGTVVDHNNKPIKPSSWQQRALRWWLEISVGFIE